MSKTRQQLLDNISTAQRDQEDPAIRAALADALREYPDDPVVLARWADYQFEQGETNVARKALQKAFSLVPQNDHHLKMALCDRMYVAGMQAFAARVMPEIDPCERTQETLARIKILNSGMDQIGVRKACERLVETAELPASHWRKVSQLALSSGHPGVAIQAFLKSLHLSGAKPADMARLVQLHIENDDLDSAWQVLKSLPAKLQRQPDMLGARAACLRKRGQKAEAIEAYMQLLDHNPEHTAAWNSLAELSDIESLPALIERCQTLLGSATLPAANGMIVRYALGHMQDRLKRTADAFGSFAMANDSLHEQYEAQRRAYEADTVEAVRARIASWFSADMFELRAKDGAGDQPIFIVGMPRSGTSLLERVVASLPNVAAGGESKALARIASDNHQQVLRKASPEPRMQDAAFWQGMADDYWKNSKVRGRFVTDKLPQNYRNLGWAMKMFPAAPIIYLKRDPRDIGWSLYKKAFRATFSYTTKQESIAHAIKECEAYMAHWQDVAPGRILTVQYEELVKNPETVTREIADFCGLEWTEACLSPEKLDVPTFTISEQQVREPINAKGLGRWREYEDFLQPMVCALEGYGLLK